METTPDSPVVRSVFPLLYVAWADGELSRDEIRAIRSKLPERFLATPQADEFLSVWLRPEAPPTAAQMQALLAAIRRAVGDASTAQSMSLAMLGRQIARSAQPSASKSELPEEMGEALVEIERLLGVASREAASDLLAEPGQTSVPSETEHRIDILPLRRLLDGNHGVLRERVRNLLSQPEFALQYGLSVEAYRNQVYAWCKRLAAEGLGAFAFPVSCGGQADSERASVVFEILAYHDTSLLIKYGVQFGLFGGSINMLGTKHHHEAYLRKVASFELPGCFAMTELGHGSNVAGLETTATFEQDSDTFVIHTPRDEAHKEYVGSAACHARMATVFAQLILAGAPHGVHAFLVPIRDSDGNPLPGVRIGDSGVKMGLNGVDNGRLWFDCVRVPRENLLNRYADVDENGCYRTSIASPSKRFFTVLGALVAGRLSIALGSLSAAKTGLAIAIRYGDRRRQFGAPGAGETKILDYRTHQRRLLPPLAAAYGLDCALKAVSGRFTERREAEQRRLEAEVAGLKAYSSWFAVDTLQACRECCGGQGYLAVNRLARTSL